MGEIERIQNWARWARENSRSIGHCSSIEHRYKSPQCWYPPEPKAIIDLFDAVRVEKVVRQLPNEYQKPFVLYWVQFYGHGHNRQAKREDMTNMIVKQLARRYKIGINYRLLWERIHETHLMVRNRLTANTEYA